MCLASTMTTRFTIPIILTAIFFLGCTYVNNDRDSNQTDMKSMTTDTATLGAGCFWCVEAVFSELKGVQKVVSGYAGGRIPNPTFKEVCDATDGCETSGEKWDAWKAFFVAGFPAQKMVFLPAGASNDAIVSYSKAFEAIKARADFGEISAGRLGVYPQMTGDEAKGALTSATQVPDSAKAFVIDWLKERYGVTLDG